MSGEQNLSNRSYPSNAARTARRTVLKWATATAIAAPFVFSRRVAAQQSRELVVVHWGGSAGDSNRAAYFEPFAKETGIRVVEDVGPTMDKVKAQLDAGKVTWDVLIDIGAFRMFQGVKQNLLEPIDYNVVTNTKDLIDNSLFPYGVGTNVSSFVQTYSTKTYGAGKHPKSWAEFWDITAFPGHRSMQQLAFLTLEMALIADGVPADKLYPLDVERAFRKIKEIKPHIDKWTTTYGQPIQLLTDGEIDLTQTFSSRTTEALAKGAPIAVEWNEGLISWDLWSVPKGAPNKAAAMQLINFSLDAKRQAHCATLYSNGPSNKLAIPLLSDDLRKRLPSSPGILEKQIWTDDKFWADNLAPLSERFTLWLAQN
jgi:putative spermidine/putrescine transport system substrate-binding protein